MTGSRRHPVRLGNRSWFFGDRVTVRAFVRPWIGHNLTSVPRYYEGRRPAAGVTLAVRAQSADDGQPDTWPGSACTGSDSPWPGKFEVHLRWRRHRATPRPLRGVLLRAATRPEGQFRSGHLTTTRRAHFAEVVVDTRPPRRVLVDPADLLPGWRAAA